MNECANVSGDELVMSCGDNGAVSASCPPAISESPLDSTRAGAADSDTVTADVDCDLVSLTDGVATAGSDTVVTLVDPRLDPVSPAQSPASSLHSELSVDVDIADTSLPKVSPALDTGAGGDSAVVQSRSSPSTGGVASSGVTRPVRAATSRSDFGAKLGALFRDARFFLMKSNNEHNVQLSKQLGVWSTPPANETKLNRALRQCRSVVLIFSVKESGRFCGFCRLGGPSSRRGPPVAWQLPASLPATALGGVFRVLWIARAPLPFARCADLYNPWNQNRPVKVGRDGQEIAPRVAQRLCRLFDRDDAADASLAQACAVASRHRRQPTAARASVHSRLTLAPLRSASGVKGARSAPRQPYRDDSQWVRHTKPPQPQPFPSGSRPRPLPTRLVQLPSPLQMHSARLAPSLRKPDRCSWSPPAHSPAVPAMFSELARELTARGAPMPPLPPPPLHMFDPVFAPPPPRDYPLLPPMLPDAFISERLSVKIARSSRYGSRYSEREHRDDSFYRQRSRYRN